MSTKVDNEKVCLVPGCGKPVQNRGLCSSCYQKCRALIRSGDLTEDAAVRNGWLLPKRGDSPFEKMMRGEEP